jgi:hypothetical protein
MALALAASATTVSREEPFSFSGGAGEAYVLIATDLVSGKGTVETFTFRRIDMAASMTLPDTAVYVRFGSRDASQKPERSLRIAGAKAAPGDYALVSRSWRQGTIVNSVCFAQGAAIYRLQPGTINIVRFGKPSERSPAAGVEGSDAALQEQVAELLASYPKMTAPTLVAKSVAAVSFDSREVCADGGR